MNKFLAAGTVLLLTLSGYLGYRVIKLKEALDTEIKKHEPGLCLSYDYSKGDFEGIINYETAQALAENYKNDKAKAWITTEAQTGMASFIAEEDTRSVWFSLDRLKNFIWHIEKQNCDSGCNETLGLRIYYAKYPDFKKPNPDQRLLGLIGLPPEYSNHHTLFMVPTYQNEKGDNVDFSPGVCRAGFDKTPLIEIKGGTDLNLKTHRIDPQIFLMGTAPDAQNHGGLIPPGNSAGTSF